LNLLEKAIKRSGESQVVYYEMGTTSWPSHGGAKEKVSAVRGG